MVQIRGKEIFGYMCLGMLVRNLQDLFSPPHIKRTTKTGNVEETIDYRAGSMAGGSVRGGIAYFLVKGAKWGLGDMFFEMARKYGDNFYNYVNRFRDVKSVQEIEANAERREDQARETPSDVSSHYDREERKKRLNDIIDGFSRGWKNE